MMMRQPPNTSIPVLHSWKSRSTSKSRERGAPCSRPSSESRNWEVPTAGPWRAEYTSSPSCFLGAALETPGQRLVGHPGIRKLGIPTPAGGCRTVFDDGHGEVAPPCTTAPRSLASSSSLTEISSSLVDCKLFLGGLQFLVEALQFLVGRKHLLGRGLALFPDLCCSSINESKPLPGVGQLPFQASRSWPVPESPFGGLSGGSVWASPGARHGRVAA